MGADSVPPDVQTARNARINSDIVKLCSSRVPMWAHPSAKGIGLFTHVAGPKIMPKNPHVSYSDQVDREVALLPLGGPKKIVPSKTREPPNKALAAIYKELQDAVRAEEKIWSDMRAAAEERGDAPKDAYRMSLDTLKQKYGGVNDPVPERSTSRPQDKRRHSEIAGSTNDEAKKKRRVSFAPALELRRQSVGSMSSTGRDTDAERRESGSRASNDYDVYRDPRRQRR